MCRLLVLLFFSLLVPFSGFCQTDSVQYLDEDFEPVPQAQATYYRIRQVTDAQTGRGYQKDFFLTGEKVEEINFSKMDSLREGLSAKWFKNGQLKERDIYVKGVREGKSEAWFENGQQRWVYTYLNGKPHGILQSFHSNSQLKRHDVYKQGKLIEGHCYDENGKKIPHFYYEIMPEFPGGFQEMMRFLARNMKKEFMKGPDKVDGLAVVTFVIDEKGEVTSVKVKRTTHAFLGDIGVRVVQSMPRWKPGLQDGEPVPVKFTVPVRSVATN